MRTGRERYGCNKESKERKITRTKHVKKILHIPKEQKENYYN
jgi:hypothetical protein